MSETTVDTTETKTATNPPAKVFYGHMCHVPYCKVGVKREMLMCAEHWSMVPALLKANVLKNYRRGQTIDKMPTREYMYAARAAINSVMEKKA